MTVSKTKSSDIRDWSPPSPVHGTKHHQLNRFLSKTFHMVTNGDPEIVSWSPNGDSFFVKDISKFSKNVLPLYFKHSKFSSFVRQLNFYGFRKIRPDSSVLTEDEETNSNAVRFFHDYFQAGKPQLLHKIHRATKNPEPSAHGQVETMQAEIDYLKERFSTITEEMDAKLVHLKSTLELEYQRRITALERSYQELVTSLVSERIQSNSAMAVANRPARPQLTPQMNPMLGLSGGGHLNMALERYLKSTGAEGLASLLR